jgi:hypothetical protein
VTIGDGPGRLLAAHVDQALIQLIVGRGAYGTAEEREAVIASSGAFPRGGPGAGRP